ncbi:Sjogren's syndrome/scleroderma autoantigen 1 family protein [Halobacteriales archaeon Cl-PHB]
MSDFDKEAERERLREKYEREEQKREVTEKMSELLLQGATMTNAHCSDCGDPIFRYDGQEFCATCEKAVDRDTGEGDEADEAAANGQPDDQIEVTEPSDEARVQFGSGAQAEGPDETRESTAEPADEPTPTQTPPQPTGGTASRDVPSVDPDGVGDLEAAMASLTRTVSDLAHRAEAAEDLGSKRDLLEATEDAAEALEAVRDAGR